MSMVKLPLLYLGPYGEKRLDTLFDPEIGYSYINAKHINELGHVQSMSHARCLNISGSQREIKVSQVAILEFYINDILVSDEFLVLPDINEEVVIAALTIRKWRMKVNLASNSVYVDPKVMIMSIGRIVA